MILHNNYEEYGLIKNNFTYFKRTHENKVRLGFQINVE